MKHIVVLLAALCLPAVCAAAAQPQDTEPYGDCCVAQVTVTDFNAWQVTCGQCAQNPGAYAVVQPDLTKLVYLGPGGITGQSPYEVAVKLCICPEKKARREREQRMRTFDGN